MATDEIKKDNAEQKKTVASNSENGRTLGQILEDAGSGFIDALAAGGSGRALLGGALSGAFNTDSFKEKKLRLANAMMENEHAKNREQRAKESHAANMEDRQYRRELSEEQRKRAAESFENQKKLQEQQIEENKQKQEDRQAKKNLFYSDRYNKDLANNTNRVEQLFNNRLSQQIQNIDYNTVSQIRNEDALKDAATVQTIINAYKSGDIEYGDYAMKKNGWDKVEDKNGNITFVKGNLRVPYNEKNLDAILNTVGQGVKDLEKAYIAVGSPSMSVNQAAIKRNISKYSDNWGGTGNTFYVYSNFLNQKDKNGNQKYTPEQKSIHITNGVLSSALDDNNITPEEYNYIANSFSQVVNKLGYEIRNAAGNEDNILDTLRIVPKNGNQDNGMSLKEFQKVLSERDVITSDWQGYNQSQYNKKVIEGRKVLAAQMGSGKGNCQGNGENAQEKTPQYYMQKYKKQYGDGVYKLSTKDLIELDQAHNTALSFLKEEGILEEGQDGKPTVKDTVTDDQLKIANEIVKGIYNSKNENKNIKNFGESNLAKLALDIRNGDKKTKREQNSENITKSIRELDNKAKSKPTSIFDAFGKMFINSSAGEREIANIMAKKAADRKKSERERKAQKAKQKTGSK